MVGEGHAVGSLNTLYSHALPYTTVLYCVLLLYYCAITMLYCMLLSTCVYATATLGTTVCALLP